MQTISAAFNTATAATTRQPKARFWVDWNQDATDWTTQDDYDNEGDNLLDFDLTVRIGVPGDGLAQTGVVDVGRVTLRDVSWRYSPWHTGGDSTIRNYISGDTGLTGIRCYLEVGFVLADTSTAYCRLFTGYIYGWQHDPTSKTVTLTLRDAAWKLFQRRGSTSTVLPGYSIDEYIGAVLDLASWPAGDRALDEDPVNIPYAWLDDEPYWQEAAEAAASVSGNLYCNANGKVVYETAAHWVGHSTKLWTFDAGYVPPVPPQITPVDLITEVVVEYSPRIAGQAGIIWQLEKPVFIRPAETETIEARFNNPALAVFLVEGGDGPDRMYDDDYYVTSPGAMNMYDFVRNTITVTTTAAGATITIQNMHPSYIACVRWMQLRGVPIVGGPSEQVKVETGAGDNYRIRSERGNPYLQNRQQAEFLATFLADRFKAIRPVWSIQNAPGVPQLELGDRIGVSDGRTLTSEREGFVTGIQSTWTTPQGDGAAQTPVFSQNIDVLDAAGLWPAATYFVIGATALGSGVAWY